MVHLGPLPGPVIGLTLMVMLPMALVLAATAVALVERRRSIGAFRPRRGLSELRDDVRRLEALQALVYDPLVWERRAAS